MLFSSLCPMQRSALTSVVVMKFNSKGEKKKGVQTACENYLGSLLLFLPKSLLYPALAEEASALLFLCLHSCCQACWAVDFLFKNSFFPSFE